MSWQFKQQAHICLRYLKQPVVIALKTGTWQPQRFWYHDRVEWLESCWRLQYYESRFSP